MTITPPEAPPARPAWTRCDKCGQRVWNDRIDIERHAQHCPADLERELRRLKRDLVKRIEDLEQRPTPHIVEPGQAERLDLEHEAPWPTTEEAPEAPDDEDDFPTARAVVENLPAPPPVRRPYDDDEDDEDDYVARPIR